MCYLIQIGIQLLINRQRHVVAMMGRRSDALEEKIFQRKLSKDGLQSTSIMDDEELVNELCGTPGRIYGMYSNFDEVPQVIHMINYDVINILPSRIVEITMP